MGRGLSEHRKKLSNTVREEETFSICFSQRGKDFVVGVFIPANVKFLIVVSWAGEKEAGPRCSQGWGVGRQDFFQGLLFFFLLE